MREKGKKGRRKEEDGEMRSVVKKRGEKEVEEMEKERTEGREIQKM